MNQTNISAEPMLPLLRARRGVPSIRHVDGIAGLRDAEIEQTVVIAGGTADEHVFQHLLDR